MDYESLVRKITDEVIRTIGSTTEGGMTTQSGGAPLCGDKSLLMLITGSSDCKEETARTISALSSSWQITVCASQGAAANLDLNTMTRNAGGVSIAELSHGAVPGLLANHAAVVVPNLTLNTLSLMTSLSTPTAASNLLVTALSQGKKVIAGNNCIVPSCACPPKAMCDKINELVCIAESYGVTFVDITELSSFISNGIATICDGQSASCVACGQCVVKRSEAVNKIVDAGADRIGAGAGLSGGVNSKIAEMIDHTLLKPDATHDQIIKLCEEARQYTFASVCVNPSFISLCKRLLRGTPVKVCTVIGFPLGATSTQAKAFETRQAVSDGAEEIDMVINVGALKSGDYRLVEDDIRAVRNACRGKIMKVILETALLNDEEKVKACQLSKSAGSDFVKTSTGFGPGGATVEDISLMRKTVGPDMGVKASGGVRDRETVDKMIQAGATRVGASASVAIVRGDKATGKGY